ncbi:MAG TPA: hypothetical protein VJC03_07370, partial [bacterium]|nr:hypothetical protein [bacterium]
MKKTKELYLLLIPFIFPAVVSARTLGWWQVEDDGFGAADNSAVYSLAVDTANSRILACTRNANGLRIYSSADGATWFQLQTNGIDDADNIEARVFIYNKGSLQLAASNSGGARFYTSSDAGTTWTLTASSLDWGVTSSSATAGFVFGDYVYLALYNPSGAQVWRSSDTFTWTRVVNNGLDSSSNRIIHDFEEYNGALYTCTDNGKIWKTQNGTSWEDVDVTGLTDTADEITSLSVFNDILYASASGSGGAELWRYNGTSWQKVSQNLPSSSRFVLGKEFDAYPGQDYLMVNADDKTIYYTENGTSWSAANYSVFKDTSNVSLLIKEAEVFKTFLYLPTVNLSGSQIWRTNGSWGVVINEVCYDPDSAQWGSENRKWIELYNYNQSDIYLAGWGMEFGGLEGWGSRFWITYGTVPAGGHF